MYQHIMPAVRIQDIDEMAHYILSASGYDKRNQIYASVCNPTVKMAPFLDDSDMRLDALELGDKLSASLQTSSIPVQKGFNRLHKVLFIFTDGCRFKELVMRHGERPPGNHSRTSVLA